MSDGPDNPVLDYLRQFADGQADIKQESREVKERLSLLGEHVGVVARSYAGMQGRIDRIEVRLERIEGRLDRQEAHS